MISQLFSENRHRSRSGDLTFGVVKHSIMTFLQNSLLRAFSAMDLNGMQGEASQSYA